MKDTTVPVSTQLDLFKTKPTASLGSSPGPVMHVMGSGKKPVIKEKASQIKTMRSVRKNKQPRKKQ